MVRMLLLSHGELSKEIYNTLELVYGKMQKVHYIIMEDGQDMEEYKEKISSYIKKEQVPVIIFVDLLGGSPFLTATSVCKDMILDKQAEIITGMNLPMLLESISHADDEDINIEKMINIAMEAGTTGIKRLGKVLKGE